MTRARLARVGAALAVALGLFWLGKRAGFADGTREQRVAAWRSADSVYRDSLAAVRARVRLLALDSARATRQTDSATNAAAAARRALAAARAAARVVAPDTVLIRDTARAVPPELLERLSATERALEAAEAVPPALRAELAVAGQQRLAVEDDRDLWRDRYTGLLSLGKDLERAAFARGLKRGRTEVAVGVGAIVIAGAAAAIYFDRGRDDLPLVHLRVARLRF